MDDHEPTPAEIARRGLGKLGEDIDEALDIIALRVAANGNGEMLQALADRRERAAQECQR